MSYHLNERLKGKVKMTAKHPYPDAPNSWPERDDSPYLQGGKNEGREARSGRAPAVWHPTDASGARPHQSWR